MTTIKITVIKRENEPGVQIQIQGRGVAADPEEVDAAKEIVQVIKDWVKKFENEVIHDSEVRKQVGKQNQEGN